MSLPHLMTGLGAVAAISLSCLGSATATFASARYALVCDDGWKAAIPVVISGVLGIYGLIVAIVLVTKMPESGGTKLDESEGYRYLSAGLAVGLACLASGTGMFNFMNSCLYDDNNNSNRNHTTMGSTTRSGTQEEPLLMPSPSSPERIKFQPITIKLCMMLVFLEALGLYGLIVALCLIG